MVDAEDPVLGEEEACTLLNLPQFLVRDFVSYEFNGLKLEPTDRKEKPYKFKKSVVKSFAEHLEAPWPGTGRPAIPKAIERYLIIEAAAGCALCLQRKENYENAHIRDFAKSRCHSPHNLIRLCLDCHTTHGDSDPKKLMAAKDLARRRVFLHQIHVGEERLARAERQIRALSSLLTLAIVAIGLVSIWLICRPYVARRIDADGLAHRLSPVPGPKRVRIQPTPNREAHRLAEDFAAAFRAAGWDTELLAQPNLAGSGVQLLAPRGSTDWENCPDSRLKLIHDAVNELSESRLLGAFSLNAIPSPEYDPDVVCIRVLMREQAAE